MAINYDLLNKIDEFPEDIRYLANELLNEIDKDKSTVQLERMLLEEIGELIEED